MTGLGTTGGQRTGKGPPRGSSHGSATPVLTGSVSSRTDFVTFHEGYIRHYIALADTKAAILFALIGAILAYLSNKRPFYDLLTNPACTLAWISAVACTAFLTLSAYASLMVIAPRRGSGGEKLVFFGAVAKYSKSDDYVAAITAASDDELTAARIRHSYDVSKICDHKYSILRASIWLGAVGMVLVFPFIRLLAPPP